MTEETVSTSGSERIRIVHVITGLSTGGAEAMLHKLLSWTDLSRYDPRVVSLTDEGEIGKKIKALGVPVTALGMGRKVPNPFGMVRLTRLLRRWKPHIVQTWMYHADLIGGLAARSAGASRIVWGIRHSDLDKRETKAKTRLTAKICAILSGSVPHGIVCCSKISQEVHGRMGYRDDRMVVIPNGFDLSTFRPDREEGTRFRQELDIPEDKLILGVVGRFHPQKDHEGFLRAAGQVASDHPGLHFILCGKGIDERNVRLLEWIEAAGLRDRVSLLGRRDDMPRVYAGLDVLVSPAAHGEGFPNVVGEAMSSEVPCIVTDVGDSAYIVGDSGLVVPPRDTERLSTAIRQIVRMDVDKRANLGRRARGRVQKYFGIDEIARSYESLYRDLLGIDSGPLPRLSNQPPKEVG